VRNVLVDMARPGRKFSGRWANDVLDRLRGRSESEGISASQLAERYVDEGLRMDEHPGIEFRDGPAGRRASLQRGPDVWQLVWTVQEYEQRGGDLSERYGSDHIGAAAEHLNLSVSQVKTGLRYYAAYPEDIDERIYANTEGSAVAEAAWLREQAASREAAA
jgi:hypothetical protein